MNKRYIEYIFRDICSTKYYQINTFEQICSAFMMLLFSSVLGSFKIISNKHKQCHLGEEKDSNYLQGKHSKDQTHDSASDFVFQNTHWSAFLLLWSLIYLRN